MFGTGAVLAGLGGLAAAALTAGASHRADSAATQAEQPVETRTVVVRKVDHRVRRMKPKHVHVRQLAAPAGVAAASKDTPAVAVQPAPVRVAPPAPSDTAPLRTRASGGGSRSGDGGDD
jgi:hypothetical protein